MNNVIRFPDRRQPIVRTCHPRCGFDDLVDRVRQRLDLEPGLLLGRDVLEAVLDDVIAARDLMTRPHGQDETPTRTTN